MEWLQLQLYCIDVVTNKEKEKHVSVGTNNLNIPCQQQCYTESLLEGAKLLLGGEIIVIFSWQLMKGTSPQCKLYTDSFFLSNHKFRKRRYVIQYKYKKTTLIILLIKKSYLQCYTSFKVILFLWHGRGRGRQGVVKLIT